MSSSVEDQRVLVTRTSSGHQQRARILGAALCVFLFAAVYAVADLTTWGQVVENGFATASDETKTIAFIPYDYLRLPPLRFEVPTIVIGLIIIVGIAALQRRWRELLVAAVGGSVSVLLDDALSNVLPRPHLDAVAPIFDLAPSFPSGHVVLVAALSMGLLIVVPRTWIRWCAPIVLGWTALVASAVLAMGWHRPSDVFGAVFLVCAVFLASTALFARAARPIGWRDVRPWVVVLVVLTMAIVFAIEPTAWHIPVTAGTSLIATALIAVTVLHLCRSN